MNEIKLYFATRNTSEIVLAASLIMLILSNIAAITSHWNAAILFALQAVWQMLFAIHEKDKVNQNAGEKKVCPHCGSSNTRYDYHGFWRCHDCLRMF